ncbi:MAG: hypothetical protein WCW77_05975 [Patescibacteria group bacterium]|jgi:hypothetical protein
MGEENGSMREMLRKMESENSMISGLTRKLEKNHILFPSGLASEETALLQRSVTHVIEQLGERADQEEIMQRAKKIFFEKLECVREKELKKCFQTEDEKKLAERVYRSLIHSLEKSVLKIATRDIMTLGNIVRDVVREAGEIKESENHFECEAECLARFQNALMVEIGMDGGLSGYISNKDARYHEKEEILFRLVNEYRKKQEMI